MIPEPEMIPSQKKKKKSMEWCGSGIYTLQCIKIKMQANYSATRTTVSTIPRSLAPF